MALTGAALGSVCQRCHFATFFPVALSEDTNMPATDTHSGLTAERARELFEYDSYTGVMTRRVSAPKSRAGSAVGCPDRHGHLRVGIAYRNYFVHRIAWLMTYGGWPSGEVDHINGIPDDNRIVNLRDVSHRTNTENRRRAQSDNSTGVLGVCWDRVSGKFRATIQTGNRYVTIGRFNTQEEAHAAYVCHKRLLHEGNTL